MAAKKAAPKGGANAVANLVQNITNRYRVTAREARDIVTAVSTVASTKNTNFLKDVPKQIKEVKDAAVSGTKGTTAYIKSKNPKSDVVTKTSRGKYEEGKQYSVGSKSKFKTLD